MRSIPVPALLRPTNPRKRLWQLGGAIALLMVTIVAINPLLPADKRVTSQLLGHDFLAFYSAGGIALEQRFQDLYDLDVIRDAERATAMENHLEVGEGFGPWWNPPFYAWAFAPLAVLDYPAALHAWIMINLLAACAAIMLLVEMLPIGFDRLSRDWRAWALVPLLLLTSMPFIQAISHAQNTCTSLLILCGVVTAWRARRAVAAGMLAGLLFYKPQLAAVLAIVMTISLGRRALLGMSFTGGILLLLTAFSMPGMLGVYLRQLPVNVHYMQVEHAYLWERHVTLKALWRLLLMGRDAGEANIAVQILTTLSALTLGAGVLIAAVRSRRASDDPWTGQTSAAARDRLIAATIVTTPLLMPFYFDYDLLLLAVPAVLFAGEIIRSQSIGSSERWLNRTWIALGAWLLINPGLARITHVNVSTILLATLSVQLIHRACLRRALGVESIEHEPPQSAPISLRAAA